MRAVLNSERFADLASRQVYATLLDDGEYHCSVPHLTEHGEVNERRAPPLSGAHVMVSGQVSRPPCVE